MSAFEQPPILSGKSEKDLKLLRDYLARMANKLEQAKDERVIAEQVQAAVKAAGGGKNPNQQANAQATALKSLIIKTADEIYSYVDAINTSLSGIYVAKSDFGEYTETVETTIEQTAKKTVESYEFDAAITALNEQLKTQETYVTELRGEIQRGIIADPVTGEEFLGIAISENLKFTGELKEENGLTYYELSPGQTLGLYTSRGWQFWINGTRRAWLDSIDGMLHVANIVIEDTLQGGEDWEISFSGGFGIRYIGG